MGKSVTNTVIIFKMNKNTLQKSVKSIAQYF
ncbi:hypothetical protein GGE08_003289 [Muricauda sp. ARW1Y1]|jgi:hypothetical protein|nr:hypothetical protein [Muricauda sp. ARW1Y1]